MAEQLPPKGDIFAETALRQKALQDQLKKAPVREIIGIVNSQGATGSNFKGQTLWTLKFTFENWRFVGSEVQKKPVTISKEVTKEELGLLRSKVKPYNIFRIRAQILEDGGRSATDGLLAEIIRNDSSDPELNRLSVELQEPVTFQDSQFGVFTLDRRVNWYEADTTWNSDPVRLTLGVDDDSTPQSSLQTARLLWNAQTEWNQKIYDCAVKKLLLIKNQSWLQDGEEELTDEAFRDAMKLETISTGPDGEFEFWFQDGDLFWGHSIRVEGSLADGPTKAGIEG